MLAEADSVGAVKVAFQDPELVCQSPLSKDLEVVVDTVMEAAVMKEESGARPAGRGTTTSGIAVFDGTEVVGASGDVSVTADTAGDDAKTGVVATVGSMTDDV